MEDIQDVHFVELENSKYLKPIRMKYTQAGRQKVWDLMKSHSSVAIVIFRTDVKKFVFVRQFRPALYMARAEETGTPVTIGTRLSQPGKEGMTLELCAGIVDKELSLPEIAKEEVLEECGYEVEVSRLEHVVTCPASVGTGGTSQTIFSLEVTEKDKKGQGGGVAEEGEFIDVVEMGVEEVKSYLGQERVNSPAGFLFAVQWFLLNRMPS